MKGRKKFLQDRKGGSLIIGRGEGSSRSGRGHTKSSLKFLINGGGRDMCKRGRGESEPEGKGFFTERRKKGKGRVGGRR